MMIEHFAHSLWHLTLDMAPFLMLGFFIAGMLYAFVPQRIYARHLARPGWRSVAGASLLGVPLPLCSCGVLPTTVSLHRSGASRGACTSFLIITPQTGADCLLATYSLLGLPFAIIRPLAAVVTGLLGGMATDRLDKPAAPQEERCECHNEKAALPQGFINKVKAGLIYAYGELLEDVGRWLAIGLLAAALITAAVPDNFFAQLNSDPLVNMAIVMLLSIPMYICATGSIPVALSLMMKGLTPGAALVLLMAGPAINMASVIVMDRVFGRRQTIIYILSVVAGAVAFGLAIDYLMPHGWFTPMTGTLNDADMHHHEHDTAPWLSITASIAFLILLVRALVHGHKHVHVHEHD